MARFYARFDQAQMTGLELNSPSLAFTRRNILTTSASAAALRNGLIASRSALSDAIYAQLDDVNKSGAIGTYFPPDLITTNQSTFISGIVYTSSVDGIRTPITNTYDVGQAINYSKRPTSSITSSQTTLVGPSTPLDSASVVYSLYVNATNAVEAVLNSIRSGSDATTNRGPFARLGGVPSRTLHSIWNDPGLQYFAWDDFTPGTGSILTPTITPQAGTLPWTFVTSSTTVQVGVSWATEYIADRLGTADLSLTLKNPANTTLTSITPSGISANDGYNWNIATPSVFNSMTGSGGRLASLDTNLAFADVTIPTNVGSANTQTISDFATILRLVTLTQRVTASLSINGPCYPVTVPVYASWDAAGTAIPSDNPAGNNTSFFPRLWRNLTTAQAFTPVDIIPGYAGDGNFYIVQSDGGAIGSQEFCLYGSNGAKISCEVDSFGQACVATTTTTTSTTTTACLEYSGYTTVATLDSCASSWPNSLYSRCGLNVGCTLHTSPGCSSPFSGETIIQVNDGVTIKNYQLSSGVITEIRTPVCDNE